MASGDDVFCRIARGEEAGYVAYSDGEVMVLVDPYPAVPGQAVVVPREHFTFFYEMPERLAAKFYSVVAAAGRAMARLYGPKAVVMLARGLRVPHYHLILMPVREGDFVDRLFSVMDAFQGFPPVPEGEAERRALALAEFLRASRAPRPSSGELAREAGRLGRAIEEELRGASQ